MKKAGAPLHQGLRAVRTAVWAAAILLAARQTRRSTRHAVDVVCTALTGCALKDNNKTQAARSHVQVVFEQLACYLPARRGAVPAIFVDAMCTSLRTGAMLTVACLLLCCFVRSHAQQLCQPSGRLMA